MRQRLEWGSTIGMRLVHLPFHRMRLCCNIWTDAPSHATCLFQPTQCTCVQMEILTNAPPSPGCTKLPWMRTCSWEFKKERFLPITAATGKFDEAGLEFQRKILYRSGLGDRTYVPPCEWQSLCCRACLDGGRGNACEGRSCPGGLPFESKPCFKANLVPGRSHLCPPCGWRNYACMMVGGHAPLR